MIDRQLPGKMLGAVQATVAHPAAVATIPDVLRNRNRPNWDRREPWWNRRAISYLARRLPTTGSVFEWGSGGSTLWFTDRGLDVTAVESEKEWADRVQDACPQADVRFIPGEQTGAVRSEQLFRDHGLHYFDRYVHAIDGVPEKSLDVVLIDGICRIECARLARQKVAAGGIVILDDSNFDFLGAAAEPYEGWRTVRVRGFKRTGLPIFETTFFHAPS